MEAGDTNYLILRLMHPDGESCCGGDACYSVVAREDCDRVAEPMLETWKLVVNPEDRTALNNRLARLASSFYYKLRPEANARAGMPSMRWVEILEEAKLDTFLSQKVHTFDPNEKFNYFIRRNGVSSSEEVEFNVRRYKKKFYNKQQMIGLNVLRLRNMLLEDRTDFHQRVQDTFECFFMLYSKYSEDKRFKEVVYPEISYGKDGSYSQEYFSRRISYLMSLPANDVDTLTTYFFSLGRIFSKLNEFLIDKGEDKNLTNLAQEFLNISNFRRGMREDDYISFDIA